VDKRWEIRFAGFGGQGIVLSSVVLGLAAVYDEKFASQRASYGSEARGGKCKSEVIISDIEISYPVIDNLQVLVALSQQGFDSYIDELRTGGLLIVDSELVDILDEKSNIEVIKIPATKMADRIGNRIVANMIMLGALQAKTGIVGVNSLQKSISESVPQRFIELNLKAMDNGRNFILGDNHDEGTI
jgi:2-oxoglutarate ferredoxin oxidoreductase subunit gamma